MTASWLDRRPYSPNRGLKVAVGFLLVAVLVLAYFLVFARPVRMVVETRTVEPPAKPVVLPVPNAHGDTLVYEMPPPLPPVVAICDGKQHRIFQAGDGSWRTVVDDPMCGAKSARRLEGGTPR